MDYITKKDCQNGIFQHAKLKKIQKSQMQLWISKNPSRGVAPLFIYFVTSDLLILRNNGWNYLAMNSRDIEEHDDRKI